MKSIGRTVNGPRGPVMGALVGRELHDDGTFSDKVFAPGYGEFFTAHEGRRRGACPCGAYRCDRGIGAARADDDPERRRRRLRRSFVEALAGGLRDRRPRVGRVGGVSCARRAAEAHRPDRRRPRGPRASGAARATPRPRNAALDLAQATLDLELRHLPPARIDRARFDLWLRQVVIDAASRDRAAVSGDVAVLEWIRDRFAHTLDSVAVTWIDAQLEQLREHVIDRKLADASATAAGLRKVLAAAPSRG